MKFLIIFFFLFTNRNLIPITKDLFTQIPKNHTKGTGDTLVCKGKKIVSQANGHTQLCDLVAEETVRAEQPSVFTMKCTAKCC